MGDALVNLIMGILATATIFFAVVAGMYYQKNRHTIAGIYMGISAIIEIVLIGVVANSTYLQQALERIGF